MVPTSHLVPAATRRARRAAALFPALLAVAALASGCSSSRPDLPRSPQDRHNMRLQGAALIDSLVLAHGGMENWNKVVEMTFRGTDEWKKPYDKVLNPWPVDRAAGQNSYRVHDGLGRLAIVTDNGTLTYGMGRTGSWALLRGQPSPNPRDERDAAYIVNWHGFLAGVPFRFKEAGAVAHYLGRAHRKFQNAAQEFDEVLVTYPPEGDLLPNDWFVVRMDPITHRMRTLTYTTTGKGGRFFETTCEFGDEVELEGMRIPTRRTCYLSAPVEAGLHTWTLADLRFNQISPDTYFERSTATLPGAPDSAAADSARAAAAAARPDSARGGTH
ncbi:MAG: hypothetical protein ACREOU_03545 [Candidatus Eiseniibacteriota bacterium]